MNTAHIHLLLNHFPIIGTIIGLAILVAGLLWKNTTVKGVAFGVFIATALLCIPAYLTGEGAEEVVEHIQGVSEAAIEAHEEVAMIALIITLILGALSGGALIASLRQKAFSGIVGFIVLATAIANMGIMYKVGNSGGLIRHTELASASAQAGEQGAGEQKQGVKPQGADSSNTQKGKDNDGDDD